MPKKTRIIKSTKELAEQIHETYGSDIFTSPESSNVEGGVYDLTSKDVVIAFRDKKVANAEVLYYNYANVKQADWDELKAAESKGKHMTKVFKVKYKGMKL